MARGSEKLVLKEIELMRLLLENLDFSIKPSRYEVRSSPILQVVGAVCRIEDINQSRVLCHSPDAPDRIHLGAWDYILKFWRGNGVSHGVGVRFENTPRRIQNRWDGTCILRKDQAPVASRGKRYGKIE